MAIQCLLKNGNWHTVRWVQSKKAKVGEKLIALDFDETTEREWFVDTVFSKIELEDKLVYHVVK